MLGSASLSAKVQENMLEKSIATNKVTTINKQDANFLFEGVETNKVAVLNDEEMKQTKGQFWGLLFAGISAGTALGQWIYNMGEDHGWWK